MEIAPLSTIKNVIIDTDPGVDDCAALLFAFGLENLGYINLLAITTVAGNVGLDLTKRNARIICDWAHKFKTAVFAGMSLPILKSPIFADDVHGKSGLGDAKIHDPKTPLQTTHAVDFLITRLLNAPSKSITLVALGPLTNIAMAYRLNPKCFSAVSELLIMGGNYFEKGNITPNAEFNFYADPIAAKIILESAINIKIFPLDVTHKACITTPRMDKLRILGNQNGRLIADLLQSYSRYDIQVFGLEGVPLHDPCPIGYLGNPSWFKGKQVFATIETNSYLMEGAMQVDWDSNLNQQKNIEWIYDINADPFFNLFTDAIATLP